MVDYITTLKGRWKKSHSIKKLPMHPIEKDPAFAEYIGYLNSPDTARYALQGILRVMAPCTLGQLTPQAVDHAIDKLTADGYKASSVDRYKRILKAFLKFSQERGHVSRNVAVSAKKVDTRQVKKARPARVPDEIRDALDAHYQDASKSTVGEMFLWAAIKTGHRISEVAMAVAEDIVLEPLAGGGYKPYIWLGTKTDKRYVALPQWVTPALIFILEAAHGDARYPLVHLRGTPVVFEPKTKSTQTLRAVEARNMFYRTQMELFGKHVANPHAFRSDFISRVLHAHPDFLTLEMLAKHCGHSADVLREYYADLLGAGPANIEEI